MSAATFALAGNPNSGKTTLFNSLTGGNQHVGNYPGVTVEKKEGYCLYKGQKIKIVDIPGTYSLTAYSLEEKVARDFLVNEKPSAVIDIIDASNLERNLYLTLQFMEMGVPVILALNMIDVAKKRGVHINTEKLSQLFGVPVVTTVAR
ncbi:MAG: 50S ribosome-binding GTPase, partial [Deltaproteobacteria bacterium]|nr:50S ribosome-binding GTPase [Deltaproteobacteria bacterium]